ncbi:MAG TPA: DUF4231 domain-containing protein [Pyrinomonadaceae bacterium]|jgi:hypothetical protein
MDDQPKPAPAADPQRIAAEHLWARYRRWSEAAVKERTGILRARRAVLILSIAGAVLGTLCQQTNGLAAAHRLSQSLSWIPTATGWGSAVALGLAALLSREVLSEERQRLWLEARTAAERYKSQTFLLRAKAPPYEKSDASSAELLAEARVLGERLGAPPPTQASDEELLAEKPPPPPMAVADFITLRVDDQIKYYEKNAASYMKRLRLGRTLSLSLGAVAVVLGALGSTYGWTAGWVAVISTIIASVSANQYANRYQFLMLSYRATAERLRWLKVSWGASDKTEADVEERNRFILDCEQTLATENNSWMAEWTKKHDG